MKEEENEVVAPTEVVVPSEEVIPFAPEVITEEYLSTLIVPNQDTDTERMEKYLQSMFEPADQEEITEEDALKMYEQQAIPVEQDASPAREAGGNS